MTRRNLIRLASSTPFLSIAALAQPPRKSPHETVFVELGGKQITISYGRPYLKGRTFGNQIAPFGKVWRLGADEATKLTTPSSIKIESGPTLVAGSYSLWAITGPDKWTIIVNKQADVWGTNYDGSQDLARFDLPVQKISTLEQFTIAFDKKSDNTAELSFAWGPEKVQTTVTQL